MKTKIEEFKKTNENVVETKNTKGLLVFVYESSNGDSTNNGLTHRQKQLILVGENINGPFDITDGEDYLVLKNKNFNNKEYLYCVPNSIIESGEHSMFGGNFVYTSDSRFPNKYPIPVHDRVER